MDKRIGNAIFKSSMVDICFVNEKNKHNFVKGSNDNKQLEE